MGQTATPWVPSWIGPLMDRPLAANRTLFLSDLHWGAGAGEPDRMAAMLRLLDALPGHIDDLIFGGDSFEFWWEWNHAVTGGHWDFLAAVRRLSNSGVRVKFIRGNHDFAIGSQLAEICQAQILSDGCCLEIGTARWLCFHGDAAPPSEKFDRVVRKILRARWAQRAWNLLHPDLAFPLAMGVGVGSRRIEPGPAKSTAEMEPTTRAWMRKFDLAGVVHGHTHRPLLTHGPEGVYINNGDWVHQRTAVWIPPHQPPRLIDCGLEGHPWLSNT